jgi:hypothetical protein
MTSKHSTLGRLLLLPAVLFLATLGQVRADTLLTGTYSNDGDAIGGPTGPWTLTSTSTPSTYSGEYLTFNDQSHTFSDLTNINAVFTSLSGGVSGGSPRFYVDFTEGGFLEILYGPPGSFAGNDATLNSQSGINLLTLNDVGRYDLSGIGGNFYTNYSDALTTAGSLHVADVEFVTDTFGDDRALELDSINVSVPDAAVPEASTWVVAALAAAMLTVQIVRARSFTKRMRLKRH